MGVTLTPQQRHDLVTLALERWGKLSMLLIPVTSHQPWRVDCDAVYHARNEMHEVLSRLLCEVDWPSPRGEVKIGPR